jgi:hypothetical protein
MTEVKRKHNAFSPVHGERLLNAIEIAHKEKHITTAAYNELKADVEKTIKEMKKK